MQQWYIAPRDDKTVKAVLKVDKDTVFSRKHSFDHRGHLQEPLDMAKVSERNLGYIHNSKESLGLFYDTYFQEDEKGPIRFRPYKRRNEIPDAKRLEDPFKAGRKARKNAGLPQVLARKRFNGVH